MGAKNHSGGKKSPVRRRKLLDENNHTNKRTPPWKKRSRSERLAESVRDWKPGPNAVGVTTEGGTDLAHFLMDSIAGNKFSIRAIRRHLATGCCRINGRVETFGSYRVKRGDVVEFEPVLAEKRDDTFDARRLVYDNNDFIAYDKPAGLPVTDPESGNPWYLHRLLEEELGKLYPVHRTDADTSGIVLFARSKLAADYLERCFREHAIRKTYHAIVRGQPNASGERRSYLVCKQKQPGFEKWGTGKGPDAREAITSWQVENSIGKFASLVRVEPQTGRFHQIRIHFSEMGHPLFGDMLYGDRKDPTPAGRHMLHASRIRIPDPRGGKDIAISSRLPKDFRDLEDRLSSLR